MKTIDGNTLKVACVQMRSGTSVERNVNQLESFVRQAAASGAQYVQTPEMTGILQRNPKLLFEAIGSETVDPVFECASRLARELKIWLHIGSTAVVERNRSDAELKAKNLAGLFDPEGRKLATYQKIHMFDVDLENGESWRESKIFEPGSKSVVTGMGPTKIGLSICYDLRFPHLYREQANRGAAILTCPASFTKQTGLAHWHTLLKARAIENGAFVIAAAQGGTHEDGRETYGHSLIVNPWGEIIAEKIDDEPGILVAELNLDQVYDARQKVPSLINGRDYIICDVPTAVKLQGAAS